MKNLSKKKKILIAAIAAVILVAIAIIIGIGQHNKAMEVRALIDQGNRYLTELDFEQAIAHYRQALNIDENNREANLALADCYIMSDQTSYAKAVYQFMLDDDSRDAEVYNKLTELYIRDGELDKAYTLMETAAENVSIDKIEKMYLQTHPERPIFSHTSGTYTERIKLEITTADGSPADIFYTIDGTDPTYESIPYKHPIILKNGETELRAVIYNTSGFTSEVVTEKFIIEIPDVEIEFQDKFIEKIVRQHLNINNDKPVYNDDIEQITSLYIVGTGYSSINSDDTVTFDNGFYTINGNKRYSNQIGKLHTLADIATLPFLESLVIALQDSPDISALSSAKSLRRLSLIGNSLTEDDLTALSKLNDLTHLCLAENDIEDISALANLTALTSLGLWNNRIVDLSPVKNLTKLTYLDFSHNRVTKIDEVQNLTQLEELWMYDNLVVNIKPVTSLDSLSVLMVRNNPIIDAESIREIYSQLTRLDTDLLNLAQNEEE